MSTLIKIIFFLIKKISIDTHHNLTDTSHLFTPKATSQFFFVVNFTYIHIRFCIVFIANNKTLKKSISTSHQMQEAQKSTFENCVTVLNDTSNHFRHNNNKTKTASWTHILMENKNFNSCQDPLEINNYN